MSYNLLFLKKGLKKYRVKVIIVLAAFFALFEVSSFSADNFWEVKKSKHFIVYYRGEVKSGYIDEIARQAEHYYSRITDYLGYRRFNFWTWDNRCRIYLYKDAQEYINSTGSIGWSRAHVNIRKKEINTYVNQESFFDTILPHEMGHIIFREFVGFYTKLPLALDEGVACAQEKDNNSRIELAKAMINWQAYIPFENLFKIDKTSLTIPIIFYSESASILNFLLESFGRQKFIKFCRRVRDGEAWEKVLFWVYKFDNMADFEKKWIDYLKDDKK
jgi:hypothetical protein